MTKAAARAVVSDTFRGMYDGINVGARIGIITGPGEFPQEGLCSTGNVIEKCSGRFGRFLRVRMDDRREETVHGLTEVGIGAYLLNNAAGRNMQTAAIEHGGQTYTPDESGEARVCYVGDRAAKYGEVDYRWELTGAHTGEPILVWMLGVHETFDESGRGAGWNGLVWADDETLFDAAAGWLVDAYTDPLREALAEIVKDWE